MQCRFCILQRLILKTELNHYSQPQKNTSNVFLYFCKHKRITLTWPKFAKNSLQSGHCSILWMRRTTVSAKACSCPILSYLPNLGFKLKAASFQLSSVSSHTISFFGIFNVFRWADQPAFISDPAESDKIGTLCRSHNLDLMSDKLQIMINLSEA